ncbi:hypothetical protein [Bradyrhizobium sp. JYMT SZCCT0428]|uniref:hypothetical protein n=1 Tax=Bradyrhizobium sp. JYMT SZCCT0428 TaxID=2807673 RepID=UPI001BAD72F2|nr:hypothetical protein [Bradyrhizobium sp. JYMT SZCCT0428]MBR1151841.1 hypothetical protein [Bradyrhizobium sp. JYMT SZCCT0428]
MLPGFRFLFAAIVLSMSVLVFGLGAAALLRASHEQFASLPSRRPPPEPVFVRQNEPPMPTLALLRVEPDVAEKVPDNVAAPIIETVTPAAPAPEASPAEPEKTAALKLDEPVKLNDAVAAETVKAEIPAAETIPAVQAAPAEMPAAETAAAETPAAKTPAANEEVKLAAIAETPPPATSAVSTEPAPVAEAPSLEGNLAAMKIATLGGPAVAIQETASVKPAAAKPERSVNRKRAQRAKERRRIAAARRALQARQLVQQAADPFAQLTARSR